MTEREFLTELLPVLQGIWKGIAAKTPPDSANDFDKKVAKEANRKIWRALGEFELNRTIDVAREVAQTQPAAPRGGYGHVLGMIRATLTGERRIQSTDVLDRLVADCRAAYQGSAEWDYPGDDEVRRIFQRGEITPLQRHRLRQLREIADGLAKKREARAKAEAMDRVRQLNELRSVPVELVVETTATAFD